MFRSLAPLRLIALAVATIAVPAQVTAQARPYAASGSAQFDPNQSDFTGTGYATHLGQYSEVGKVSFSPTRNPTVFAVDGWTHYISANGDELHAVVSGTVDMVTGAIRATATYVGGTGRFATARGSSALTGQMLGGGALTIAAAGSVSY